MQRGKLNMWVQKPLEQPFKLNASKFQSTRLQSAIMKDSAKQPMETVKCMKAEMKRNQESQNRKLVEIKSSQDSKLEEFKGLLKS